MSFDSNNYWETRYYEGGDSGAGSYGRLADFKALVLNDFVKRHRINSVNEVGCGDGNQLSLAEYPHYLGLDVSETAIKICLKKFKNDRDKQFKLFDGILTPESTMRMRSELAISLDVLFHLIDDHVFSSYMKNLFALASHFVVIYSSNEFYPGETAPHVLDRCFTDWVKEHQGNWDLVEIIPNIYPFDPKDPDNSSRSDFYIYKNGDKPLIKHKYFGSVWSRMLELSL